MLILIRKYKYLYNIQPFLRNPHNYKNDAT